MFAFYLGVRKERARFECYGSIKKPNPGLLSDAMAVTVLSGTLMTYEEWMLAHFSKWIFDVCTAGYFCKAILTGC